MDESIVQDAALMHAILDAYPAPTLLVDGEFRTLFVNRSARQVLGLGDERRAAAAVLERVGNLLRCAHAKRSPGGCGAAEACGDCVIRNSVGTASRTSSVHRTHARVKLDLPGGVADAHFLISAAPVQHVEYHAIILTLEDVSDVVKLASLLPICFHCRRIRNEEDYWQTVEDYFKQKADIDFSHAICAECLERHYPPEQP